MKSLYSMLDMPKETLQQRIKWIVYSLLFINFILYFKTDWQVATHTMRHGGTLLEWSRAFATTIDESAWMFLLIIFESETYILSDEPLSRFKAFLMHSIRIICYLSLAHTLYALAVYLYDVNTAQVIKDVSSLCQLLGKDISYTANLVYTELNANNCKSLSSATQFLYLDSPKFLIVTDNQNIDVINQLAWVDMIEAVTWLLILFTIEMVVRLQDKGTASGVFLNSLNLTKTIMYILLWSALVYWLYRGHFMFAWDEFMWIAGFFVIGTNLDQWRDEIIQAQDEKKIAAIEL
ncbi:MAG: hypothetical protein HRT38_09500 [Alteromonadaceae bacterium]|nr:hypothetical protein [Alteromonadaceae bacterium]